MVGNESHSTGALGLTSWKFRKRRGSSDFPEGSSEGPEDEVHGSHRKAAALRPATWALLQTLPEARLRATRGEHRIRLDRIRSVLTVWETAYSMYILLPGAHSKKSLF